MKLTIERAAFLKALGHVQSVVERRTTIPILSNVLLRAEPGRLALSATDMDLEVVERVPAQIEREGRTTAPAHTLYDIVRKLRDGAQIEIDVSQDLSGTETFRDPPHLQSRLNRWFGLFGCTNHRNWEMGNWRPENREPGGTRIYVPPNRIRRLQSPWGCKFLGANVKLYIEL